MSVRPDFVMLGVHEPDGSFAIYASTDLRNADLVAERVHPMQVIMAAAARGIPPTQLPAQKFDLTAELAGYVVGRGPSYREALSDLLRVWQPPPAPHELVTVDMPADTSAAVATMTRDLNRPRFHNRCQRTHKPGDCEVHNVAAENCTIRRDDGEPFEPDQWCEPCGRARA